MDSVALETFVAVHRAGGFSQAAQVLGRSQPAISRRIALLEDELGAPLFERALGGVVLSQAGRELMPHALRALAALKDAGDAVRALRSSPAGPLVLLRHKFLHCAERALGAAQHGHRGRLLTRASARRRRMVAMELGMCRSVRSGGASGSVTGGNGKLREQPGGTRS